LTKKIQKATSCHDFTGTYAATCNDGGKAGNVDSHEFKLTQNDCSSVFIEEKIETDNTASISVWSLEIEGAFNLGITSETARGSLGAVGYWVGDNQIKISEKGQFIISEGRVEIDRLEGLKLSGVSLCEGGVEWYESDLQTIFNSNDEQIDKTVNERFCSLCKIES